VRSTQTHGTGLDRRPVDKTLECSVYPLKTGVRVKLAVNKDGPAKIRVMIANDHPIMRVGLRLAVRRERDMEIVGETKGTRETIEVFPRLLPDVVIMDFDSPNRRGPDTIQAIRRTCPDLPLIVLSSYPIDADEQLEHPGPDLMFVLKSCSGEEIIAAVRTLVSNRRSRSNSPPL
jgi:DNA-binding NarL/FixJ family response regulator